MRTLLLCLLLTPFIAAAQDYEPLVGIPGISAGAPVGVYVNSLFLLAISLGAIIAVVQIVIAGAQWMLSDIVTTKQQALTRIRGAVIGLLILLGLNVVYREINDDILNLDIFSAAEILRRESIQGIPERCTATDQDCLNRCPNPQPDSFGRVRCGGPNQPGTVVKTCVVPAQGSVGPGGGLSPVDNRCKEECDGLNGELINQPACTNSPKQCTLLCKHPE